jgi:hypothetical protein
MITFSEYRLYEQLKFDKRKYNDILKNMGVMNDKGKVNLENMIDKINKFLDSDNNKEKFLKDVEKNKIEGEVTKIKAKKLKPGQQNIFLDKVITRILSVPKLAKKILKGKMKDQDILISSDNYIIDGHHRWASAFLLNSKCKIKCTRINLPIVVALPILNGILNLVGSTNQQQSGNEEYDVYKLVTMDKDELKKNLSEIVKKIAEDGLWGSGKKSPHMIGKFFIKIGKKIEEDLVNHLIKNIYKLPNPYPESTNRKDMPQFKKNEIQEILKEF